MFRNIFTKKFFSPRRIPIIALAFCLVILVPLSAVINSVAVANKQNSYVDNNANVKDTSPLKIFANLNFFDYSKQSVTGRFVAIRSLNETSSPILSIGGKNSTLSGKMNFIDGTFSVIEASPSNYPFDKYWIVFTFDVYSRA
ncbi:hypothetical protein BC833DRAFT_606686 [Globomyces pollinis-pini]|nr:hypothetical protein BC833DRAFT_606686 [Globomyces pollinis-pini]